MIIGLKIFSQSLGTTMCKNNSRDTWFSEVCSPLQLSCNLIDMKPEIGYYSYDKRYRT